MKLFGDGHRYYGYMDYFLNIEDNTSGTGVRDLFARLTYDISERSELELTYHNFTTAGKLYDPFENDGADDQLGNEIDLQFKHAINSYLSFTAAYATLFAKPAMELLKGGDHKRYQQWALVMLTAKPQLFTSKKDN